MVLLMDPTIHDAEVSVDSLRARASRHHCHVRSDAVALRRHMEEPSYEAQAVDIVAWMDLAGQGYPVPAVVHDAAGSDSE